MKKLFFVLLISSTTVPILHAQDVKFGFAAGAAFANYKAKADGISFSAEVKTGITAGILIDIPVDKNFSFQPALNFVQKGTKYEFSDFGITEESKMTVNLVEVPLNVLFNYPITGGTLFVGAGPSVAFALSGKEKYDDGTQTDENEISFGNDPDNDDMKGLDLGINLLGGFRLTNGLFVSTGFNAGLNNLLPGGSDEGTLKSNYFSVKIGFMLNCAKKKAE